MNIKPRIAIFGDMMIDHDVSIRHVKDVDGVPVYAEISRSNRLGGSSNVATLCESLGAEIRLLSPANGTLKSRFINGNNILFRIDDDHFVLPTMSDIECWKRVLYAFKPHVILICDHQKGAITKGVINLAKSSNASIIVDPCMSSDWSLFNDVECISANEAEWKDYLENRPQNVQYLINRKDVSGVLLVDKAEATTTHFPSICTQPVDTVGAGDQFLAALAVRLIHGYSYLESVEFANVAAGLQCERRGIVPLTMHEIETALKLRS